MDTYYIAYKDYRKHSSTVYALYKTTVCNDLIIETLLYADDDEFVGETLEHTHEQWLSEVKHTDEKCVVVLEEEAFLYCV